MKPFCLKIALLITMAAPTAALAQFGSGVVFDPTQSAHALQQIEQGQNIFTNSVNWQTTPFRRTTSPTRWPCPPTASIDRSYHSPAIGWR